MNKLDWKKLLNPNRRKSIDGGTESSGSSKGRFDLERDHDRILFATPTRRLADKTQVFSMDKHDSIRTRLTHSLEVANLSRSIGIRIAFDHANEVFGSNHDSLEVKRTVPALLAAIGLAHDLGNPPFGHQGEIAMQSWFRRQNTKIFKDQCHEDFLHFDGNGHTFRLLARLQTLDDDYGLNLSVATLAALLKYPYFHDSKEKGYDKWGIFESERKIAQQVWLHTGLAEGQRHPLTYIMDACDDIAYSVIDAEDTVKKGYASFYDLMAYLKFHAQTDKVVKQVVEYSENENEHYRNSTKYSSRELVDMSMQKFRVSAINEMVEAAVETYVSNVGMMMDGNIAPDFDLINSTKAATLCKLLKEFDKKHGFQHEDVLRIELEGNNYIQGMMNFLWDAITGNSGNKAFDKYAYGRISEKYRTFYENEETKLQADNDEVGLHYAQCQLLCDAVAGMTDSYLILLYNELRPLHENITR